MFGRLRSGLCGLAILSALWFVCPNADADDDSSVQLIEANLQIATGVPTSAELAQSLRALYTLAKAETRASKYRREPLTTWTLVCIGLNFDIYIGGNSFACSDLDGKKYAGFGVGAGFGAGFTGSAFLLIGNVFASKGIAGRYSGVHAAGAFGYYGADVGVFYRNDKSGIFPDSRFTERLYWVGYQVGLNLDFSALEVAIGEW